MKQVKSFQLFDLSDANLFPIFEVVYSAVQIQESDFEDGSKWILTRSKE
jgi:hypothetical protein